MKEKKRIPKKSVCAYIIGLFHRRETYTEFEIETLCDGTPNMTVRRWLDELVEGGWLKREAVDIKCECGHTVLKTESYYTLGDSLEDPDEK
jgi:hypothetical protein